MSAPPLHEFFHISDKIRRGLLSHIAIRIRHTLVEDSNDGMTPLHELAMILGRDPHQLGNHRDRDGGCVIGNDL